MSGSTALAEFPSVWGSAQQIDGVLDSQEWADVTPYVGKLSLAFGKEDDLLLYVMNDDEFLYIAIQFKAQKLVSSEALFITLDERLAGKYYEGQDILGLAVRRDESQVYYDQARTMKPPCSQKPFRSHKVHCAFEDTRMDGTTDGSGVYRYDGQTAVYEFAKPLKSDDSAFDVQLQHGQWVGLNIALTAVNANYSNVLVPGPTHQDFLIVTIAGPMQRNPR